MTTPAKPAADTGVPEGTIAAPIRAIHPRMPKWRSVDSIDAAEAECDMLAHLLGATHDIIREMNFVLPDGRRNIQLDNVSALIQIGQGLAEYLTVAIGRLPRPSGERRA